MKAVVIRKHGGPDVLSYEEIARPRSKSGHAIIKVSCCAVNHLDIWVRKGLTGRKVLFPHVLGCDVCGTLMGGFGNFKKGEKVVVYPAIKSDIPRVSYTIIGGFGKYHGGYAEFIQVPQTNIVRKPAWLSDAEACALNVSYLTAWNMLERSNCKKGDTILIWGSNSGVGSAAILLAKAKGIKVITVASNANKVRRAKRLGANLVIDRSKLDVIAQVLKYTKNRGVDTVIDHVGAKTWSVSIEALKVGGIMLACGTTSGSEATINIRAFYSKEAQIIGAYLGTKSQLISLHKFMKSRKIRPVIDKVFDLKDAILAHRKIESGNQFGKIILKI
ncbi:MAG TPA: zinc-binding dehydrogenase [Nitrosopumilaceae archaeon]|nr:zinc-binding dehydrogenase [Nitrosopumilaceae archaeon]